MEVVKSLLKTKLTPQQQLREWQRRLCNEGRNIERQIRDVQKEEKKVEKAIRAAAKAGDACSWRRWPRSWCSPGRRSTTSTRTRPSSTPSPCTSARSSVMDTACILV
uniref:Uncharacterized protein n=1 Tax=Aegilops tauschii subsp. strangulata TaxID=200361 RepID=A0A453JJT5_AEGTS